MMDIFDFSDFIEEKYRVNTDTKLKVRVPSKHISQIIPVTFLSDYSGASVGILWEDADISNYEALGLLGMYHTTGKNMVYNKDEQSLTIDNGDGHMIIIEG